MLDFVKNRAAQTAIDQEDKPSEHQHLEDEKRARAFERAKANLRPGAPQPPRSDLGTIILHWSLAIAIVTSLATGLRWSSDRDDASVAKALSGLLPQGELWTWHFVSAIVVTLCMVGYAIYLSLGRLKRRVSPRKALVLTLPASAKLRWGAVNVLLYWALFACVAILFVTGVLLYLGHGGLVVEVHYISALVVAGYVVVHVLCHYMFGGVQQWLRLFRAQKLRSYKGMVRWPAAIAIGLGAVAAAVAVYADFGTRDGLVVVRVTDGPVLDGKLDDAAWQNASAVSVRTQQGSNLGGSGESTVEIRSVTDGEHIYFAFRWQDPSRSLKRLPLVKREDGWHLLNDRADIADETAFYEDKFAVMFSNSDAFGSGGSTFMGPKPLDGKPGALNKRGLHYTSDGSLIDVWQWKAARGGMLGVVDDMWFGAPLPATEKQMAGSKRYSGGYAADPGKNFYVYNYVGQPPGGYRQTVDVKRLPVDHEAMTAKLGRIELVAGSSDDKGAQWWMFDNETIPYSPQADAGIPVGTVIPGVLISGTYQGSRADVSGGSQWQDGHWVLETRRKLRTGNEKDLDMVDGLFVWVSVFDNNQTRHTRHVRPVRLQMDNPQAGKGQQDGK